MKLSSNLTLELFDQPFLLEKRIELLYAIQQHGSINKAAKAVPMSYKKAWEAIDAMNNLSSTPIVQRETGGKGGGGTHLTSYGENLLKTYTILKKEQAHFLNKLHHMTDIDTGTLKTIGRLGMQISARNQLQGIIEKINIATVNAEVYVKIKSGYTLVSNITKTAVENLNLQPQDEVTVFFKSNTVLLTIHDDLHISARNQLQGEIEQINQDSINAEVLINIGNNDKIASITTAHSVKQLQLQPHHQINAIIKASDIMIGK